MNSNSGISRLLRKIRRNMDPDYRRPFAMWKLPVQKMRCRCWHQAILHQVVNMLSSLYFDVRPGPHHIKLSSSTTVTSCFSVQQLNISTKQKGVSPIGSLGEQWVHRIYCNTDTNKYHITPLIICLQVLTFGSIHNMKGAVQIILIIWAISVTMLTCYLSASHFPS